MSVLLLGYFTRNIEEEYVMNAEIRPEPLSTDTVRNNEQVPVMPSDGYEAQAPPGIWDRVVDPEGAGRPIAEQFQQTGDPELLSRLMELYYRPLTKFAERMYFKTGDKNIQHAISAEDAVQSVMLKVLTLVQRRQERGEALPLLQFRYFAHSVRMHYIDHYRERRKIDIQPTDEVPETAWSSDNAPVDIARLAIQAAATRDLLDSIFNVLPHQYRQVALDRWQGRTVDEVAAARGIHRSTVIRIMHRVRELIGPIVEAEAWMRELIADE